MKKILITRLNYILTIFNQIAIVTTRPLLLLFLVSLFFSEKASGQISISGSVFDTSGSPIAGASVKLLQNDHVVYYAISGKDGRYQITINRTDTVSYVISVSHLSYALYSARINTTRSITQNFILRSSEIVLPEVRVGTLPVVQNEDTIIYDPAVFSSKSDRAIGDVLKRIPGITISSSGQVSFNGKIISHYYIDGLDLLGGKYNLANNNISFKDVSKVEIWQNHQDKQILKGIEEKDQPAINVRLKNDAKNRLILLAKSQLGRDTALLYGAEVTAIAFTKKVQLINVLKTNNLGNDLSTEITLHSVDGNKNPLFLKKYTKSDILSISKPSSPPLEQSRFLFNRSSLLSSNFLFAKNKDSHVRINLDYYKDVQIMRSSSMTDYFFSGDTISVEEYQSLQPSFTIAKGLVQYLINSPKSYLNNELRIDGYFSKENSNIKNFTSINEVLNNPFYQVANDIEVIKKIKKSTVHFNSFLLYKSIPQQLNVIPGVFSSAINGGVPYDELIQTAKKKQLDFNNSVSTITNFFRFQQKYQLNLSYQRLDFSSGVDKRIGFFKFPLADSFSNRLVQHQIKLSPLVSLNVHSPSGYFRLLLPYSFTLLKQKDTLHKINRSSGFAFFNPSIEILRRIGNFWELDFTISTGKDLVSADQTTLGYVVNTYRNIRRRDSNYLTNRYYSGIVGLSFKNPLKSLFLNINLNHTLNNYNAIDNQFFSGIFQSYSLVTIDNNSNSTTLISNISKYAARLKTTFSFELNMTNVQSQVLQSNILVPFKSFSYSITGKILSKKISNCYIENRTIYSKSNSEFGNSLVNNTFETITNSFSWYYSFAKVFSTGLSGTYQNNKVTGFKPQGVIIADFSLSYRQKNNELLLKINNLTNTKKYQKIELYQNVKNVSSYDLRGVNFWVQYNFRIL